MKLDIYHLKKILIKLDLIIIKIIDRINKITNLIN